MLKHTLFLMCFSALLAGCSTCVNVLSDDECTARKDAVQRDFYKAQWDKEQLQAKERKDEYQKQVASSMEHYRDDIKKLHVFPSGSNNDRYFVVSDNIVGCSDPGIAWAISRKLHSSPPHNSSGWVTGRDPEVAEAVIAESGCMPVSKSVPWRVLFSVDHAHYMFSATSGVPVRLWFAYGEIKNRYGAVPPTGTLGALYPQLDVGK
ncbi:Putative phage protein [Gluconobacter oxydans 621H]|uniref:Putative phage protein n=1 Tax=Gluconobacter oxydans (strain 621H) TaxID=290633 RepID=Q5FNI9_GLUOX|nr:Putative phage protein [Gluconobacter oxydans 621H]